MKNRFLILLLIIFTTATSLAVAFLRMPKESVFDSFGKAESTPYNISFYNNYEEIIFTVSPLNDYYYRGSLKEHLVNKLGEDKRKNLWQEFLVSMKGLFLNRKELFWEVSENDFTTSYDVLSKSNEITILRKVKSLEKDFDAIGQSITICPKCLITDDQKRAYLSDSDLDKGKIDILEKIKFIPVIVREEQFLPSDIKKISILNETGESMLDIPVLNNEQISFQDKWEILEFKTPISQGKEVLLKQVIYIPKI